MVKTVGDLMLLEYREGIKTKQFIININNIVEIEAIPSEWEKDSGSRVYFEGGGSISVTNSVSEIWNAIEKSKYEPSAAKPMAIPKYIPEDDWEDDEE